MATRATLQTPKSAPVGKKKVNLLANKELEMKSCVVEFTYRINTFVGFSEPENGQSFREKMNGH